MLRFCVLPLLIACNATKANIDQQCTNALERVDVADDSLGFSALDVVELLTETAPNRIGWTKLTQGDTSADLHVSFGSIADDVSIVEDVSVMGGCRSGQALRVPVEIEIDIANGQGVAGGTFTVDAVALSPDAIFSFSDLGWLPITLQGDYAEQMMALAAENGHAADDIAQLTFSGLGDWRNTDADIEVDYVSIGIQSGWRGYWYRE